MNNNTLISNIVTNDKCTNNNNISTNHSTINHIHTSNETINESKQTVQQTYQIIKSQHPAVNQQFNTLNTNSNQFNQNHFKESENLVNTPQQPIMTQQFNQQSKLFLKKITEPDFSELLKEINNRSTLSLNFKTKPIQDFDPQSKFYVFKHNNLVILITDKPYNITSFDETKNLNILFTQNGLTYNIITYNKYSFQKTIIKLLLVSQISTFLFEYRIDIDNEIIKQILEVEEPELNIMIKNLSTNISKFTKFNSNFKLIIKMIQNRNIHTNITDYIENLENEIYEDDEYDYDDEPSFDN
jgi:hypothetical protein